MNKIKPILLSIVWTVTILIFPVASGVIAVVSGMGKVEEYITQGCFMLLSLIPPAVHLRKSKTGIKEIGLRRIDSGTIRTTLFFIPAVLSEMPLILAGTDFKSLPYTGALSFFALTVGISEELYFRGVILKLLKESLTSKQAVVISALIFGIGHIAGALSGKNSLDVLLQVMNAVVFGILAAETVYITKSLIPSIIWHFAFNFVNRVTLAAGTDAMLAAGLQVIVMIIYAYVLWGKLSFNGSAVKKDRLAGEQ
jgi:membrane protease YdiL (CAAX protease family)